MRRLSKGALLRSATQRKPAKRAQYRFAAQLHSFCQRDTFCQVSLDVTQEPHCPAAKSVDLSTSSRIHVALQQPTLNRLQVSAPQVLQGSGDDGAHPQFTAAVLQRLLSELLGFARQLLDLHNEAVQRVGVDVINHHSKGGYGCRLHVEHKRL